MSTQFMKPVGLRFMTSRTDSILNRTAKIPWYIYFIGGMLYTVFASVMFAESTWPVLSWISAISAPLGFYYAWGAWKQETRNGVDASDHALKQDGQWPTAVIERSDTHEEEV